MKNKYSDIIIDEIGAETLSNVRKQLENNKKFSNELINDLCQDLSYMVDEYIKNSFDYIGYYNQKQGKIIRNPDGILGICEEYMALYHKKNSKDILLKEDDQFNVPTVEATSRSEVLANVMYFANVAAHVLIENKQNEKSLKNLSEEQLEIGQCISDMYRLKTICIQELIKEKENGEILNIAFNNDDKGDKIFSVIIPDYFEPFVVHLGSNHDIQPEIIRKYQSDDLNKFKKNTIYPFKVSRKMAEPLKYIYKNIGDKDLNRVRYRITWYFNAQDKLNRLKNQMHNAQKNQTIEDNVEDKEGIDKENSIRLEQLEAIKQKNDSIKGNDALKEELKETERTLKETSQTLKRQISINKNQLEKLEEKYRNLVTDESKEQIIQEILALKDLIISQQQQRNQLKASRKVLKTRIDKLKAKMKNDVKQLSEAINEAEL